MQYTTHLFRHTRAVIGRNIHYHRTAQNMTLESLSSKSGVSAALLDKYETGRDEITLQELLKIACALGQGVTAMMTGAAA